MIRYYKYFVVLIIDTGSYERLSVTRKNKEMHVLVRKDVREKMFRWRVS